MLSPTRSLDHSFPNNSPTNTSLFKLTMVGTQVGVNTQVGDDIDASTNESDFHILEFHLPTLGVGFSITLAIGLLAFAVWYYLKRRAKKSKKKVEHREALTWESQNWHRQECARVDLAKECTCPRRLERPPAVDSPGYRMYRCELP